MNFAWTFILIFAFGAFCYFMGWKDKENNVPFGMVREWTRKIIKYIRKVE
jgi:hypothetical protein